MFRAMFRLLAAAAALSLSAQAALAERRVALVIGNSNYTLAPLTNPKNDADDVAGALQRLQFDVTERKDLTVRDFDRALDDFIPKAQNADVALFFFSGHGVQIDKRGYLAPVDLRAETESSALRELVAIQEIVSRIENAAKVSVVVLDACRDSPLQERLRRIAVEKNRALVPPKGLPPVSVAGSNTLIVYATVPGETASDGNGRNSPFTASLLRNIETPDLEIELMFKRVTGEVLRDTRGKQQPERLSRLQNELMLVPVSASSRQQAPMSEAARAWNEIKDQKDPFLFETFRQQYDGFTYPLYNELARQRLEELRRGTPPGPGHTISGSSDWRPFNWKPPEGEKPKETQTAVIAPPKPAPPPEAACDGLLVTVAMGPKPCIKPGSGEVFKDCPECPEMVAVPAGSYIMGSPAKEPERSKGEGPQHRVTFSKPFAAGSSSVTQEEFDAFVHESNYQLREGCLVYQVQWHKDGSSTEGWVDNGANSYLSPGFAQTRSHPAVCVSWDDAKAYASWLSKRTGEAYTLLSEAQREYVTRAGTVTPFWWGQGITSDQANYNAQRYTYGAGGKNGKWRQITVPVKTFQPNPWGLYQVHGNVEEWIEDCYGDNYTGAQGDGSAPAAANCDSHVTRGGSWVVAPEFLRSAARNSFNPASRANNLGFRVARTLE